MCSVRRSHCACSEEHEVCTVTKLRSAAVLNWRTWYSDTGAAARL
jgi:hypothetical protein